MNPKDGFDFNENCGHFLIKAEGGAKNYKRDHPLPLSWRSFTVTFVQRMGCSYELTWVSEYNEVPVLIYPCFN